MKHVSIRELRNRGGDVIDRVMAGESLTVTRSGRPVAELRPLPKPPLDSATILSRRKFLPKMDPDALRQDLDRVIDPSL